MLKGRLGLDSAKVPHSDRAGCLYLARGQLTAFKAAKQAATDPSQNIERLTRRMTGRAIADQGVIPAMIDHIKALIDGRDP